jgi:hypothetical protein
MTKAKVNSSVLSDKQVLLLSVLLVGAAAFAQTTQVEGSQIFAISSTSKFLQGCSALCHENLMTQLDLTRLA